MAKELKIDKELNIVVDKIYAKFVQRTQLGILGDIPLPYKKKHGIKYIYKKLILLLKQIAS